MLHSSVFEITDGWLSGDGPEMSVVVSCRARFARNIAGLPFPPRAHRSALRRVTEIVQEALGKCGRFRGFHCLKIDGFSENDRQHLRESQVISVELERGGEYRLVYIGGDPITALMVNEEDHLRFFVILPGLRIMEALDRLREVDDDLQEQIAFAFSDKFGYLTACPTNTGTALRASVMLHLPGLALTEEMDQVLKEIAPRGMAARGIYGENSAHMGNFYQISNETTLGLGEEEIAARLDESIREIVGREKNARDRLFSQKRTLMEDKIYRALSTLKSSRIINSQEAVDLLSVLRLGIDRGFLPGLAHDTLNRLIVQVQPGHLQRVQGRALNADKRDVVRANFLRDTFGDISSKN